MRYLLDTHVLLWAFFEPEKLSRTSTEILQNNSECYLSNISLLEISLKYGLGKLQLYNATPEDILSEIKLLRFNILELKKEDIVDFYKLPQLVHKDPFDKMIVWQAIKNNLTLISQDKQLEVYKANGLKIDY